MIKVCLLAVSLTIAHVAIGQTGFAECAAKNITTGNADQLDSLTTSLVKELAQKDFYLIGEAHTFLANNDFQFSLIKALHPYQVYNVANELPHATCFLFNQYLETGNDSLLNLIQPAATYNLLKKVRDFNLLQPLAQRVKYYGIDYVDARDGYPNFYRSLQIIRDKIHSQNLPLDIFIEGYLQKGKLQYQDVVELNNTLFLQLQSDSTVYKKHFGVYYNDLLLMASNMIGNRTNRDADIFKSYSLLHQQLSATQPQKPKFIAFYGMGHLDNLGDKLSASNQSPVKNSVCKIGIQYVHCLGGWTTAQYRDDGLYKINKKNLAAFINYCKQNPWQVGVFANTECFDLKRGSELDAVVVFHNYGDRKMNSWKFD